MAKPKYKRVLLKLSGEVFGGKDDAGLSQDALMSVADSCKELVAQGVQVALVIGGGNILRGGEAAQEGMNRAQADTMGMLATMINGLALQDALERAGLETRLTSAIAAIDVCEPFTRRRAINHLEKGRIVILSGGTGRPYFTTDTTAALRAIELGAEVMLKATKVDGVYSADPMKDKDAIKYDELSYMKVLQDELKVMDTTAISLCMDNELPILVFNMSEPRSVTRAVMGEKIGTLVTV